MARSRKEAWSLDPEEVSTSLHKTTLGRRGKAALSRELDVTEAEITLTHGPTGLSASGKVPPGHYSRREMGRLRDDLQRGLFEELERAVARHLRIPGR